MNDFNKDDVVGFSWRVMIFQGYYLNVLLTVSWVVVAGLVSCKGFDSTANIGGSLDEPPIGETVQHLVVQTSLGSIRGFDYQNSQAFLGIPYAEPAVGELRFAPPVPATRWDGELQATSFGPPCPQFGREVVREDCLTLNIWTPGHGETLAPVMVWIHGGGMRTGSGDGPFAEGRFIAESTDTVVVSLNYRLGPFGFLAHPALGEASGNWGFLDQQVALRWVRDNIGEFGGDPNNVTLFGESAGSASTCLHMTSSASQGLFHKAILQSGPCASVAPDGMSPVVTREEAEGQGIELAQVLGCHAQAEVARCLRRKSMDEILGGLPLVPGGIVKGTGVNWLPNIDGTIIADQPLTLINQGNSDVIPTIVGSNGDEGTVFSLAADLLFMTGLQYTERVHLRFGSLASQVLEEYPPFGWGLPFSAYSKLIGDMVFVCPARQTARALSEAGAPTFLYSFDVVPSYASAMAYLGAFHAAEIPFVFHSLPWPATFSSREEDLSLEMVKYWTTFARYGDPNSEDSVSWPRYSTDGDSHLEFRLHSIEAKRYLSKDDCDFWDSVWPL